MDKELLKLIVAQQLVLFEKIIKIEKEVGIRNNGSTSSPQQLINELQKDAEKIMGKFKISI